MLATYDIVSILQRELAAYKCPASSVASLAGVSGGRLSAFLKEQARPSAEQDLALRKTWSDIKKLVNLARPLALDLTDFPALRDSIQAMNAGQLHIAIFTNEVSSQGESRD